MASFGNTSGKIRSRRIYRLNPWIRIFAVAFLLFSLAGMLGLLWSQRGGVQATNLVQTLEWGGIAAFSVGWTVYVFTAVIVLSESAIEKRTLLKTDRLPFEEIRGRRETLHRNFDGSSIRYLEVIPRDPLKTRIKFQKFYVFDAAFFAWYDDLPDLDGVDHIRARS